MCGVILSRRTASGCGFALGTMMMPATLTLVSSRIWRSSSIRSSSVSHKVSW